MKTISIRLEDTKERKVPNWKYMENSKKQSWNNSQSAGIVCCPDICNGILSYHKKYFKCFATDINQWNDCFWNDLCHSPWRD